MKPNQSKGESPVHKTVAEKIKFQTAGRPIQIEFTDQQLSPHAGTATFWSFLHRSGRGELVERRLPHPAPGSNNALPPLSKVFSFVQGLLCGAKKPTHVAYLRRDPMMPALLGIDRRVRRRSKSPCRHMNVTGGESFGASCSPLIPPAMQSEPGPLLRDPPTEKRPRNGNPAEWIRITGVIPGTPH